MLEPNTPYALHATLAAGAMLLSSLTGTAEPEATLSAVPLVTQAGDATYLQLAGPLPAHSAPRLVDDTLALADVRGAHAHLDWLGRTVFVDGTCAAKVTGFVVVARVAGMPEYAPGNHARWTAENVFAHGTPALAAKLDGCRGTFATDRAFAQPEPIENAVLAKRARAKLVASGAAADAQFTWEQAGRRGAWHASETAEVKTIVVRHHGQTFVSAHGTIDEGCGGPEINVWALYRVVGRELETVELRDGDELWSIDRLVDVDGDGAVELVGRSWLGTDLIITRANGEEVARRTTPFFGCAC